MTPREKAQDLVYIYSKFQSGYGYKYKATQCALIAVDELLKHEEYMIEKFKYQCSINGIRIITSATYWEQVKHELKKL
jgi:hypothetical protein